MQDSGGCLGLAVAYGDRLGEAAGAVEDLSHLVYTDLPLRVHGLGEAVEVEGDALLGEIDVAAHAEEGCEHAGWLLLGAGFEIGEWCAVQVLNPFGDQG
ncbi:hypothetical protein ACIQNI_29055 [Streptomyces sp. NPDC091266]|uniref:hypothetical protein n=1 Tax=Streptomyces sp. NPDC091266 TaxID=3365978 RepID=UPI0038290C66